MHVLSTNIGQKRTHFWKGKEYETGIYKFPVEEGIYLEKYDVIHDAVVDRKYHGGIDKACYIYSYDHYPYWQEKYPHLDFHMGMMGENITAIDLDETQLYIGDTFEVGDAIIQISQPRQPCRTLGIKFNDQSIIREFINTSFSGFYIRIIKPGLVVKNDIFQLVERQKNPQRLDRVFSLIKSENINESFKQSALENPFLANAYKSSIA